MIHCFAILPFHKTFCFAVSQKKVMQNKQNILQNGHPFCMFCCFVTQKSDFLSKTLVWWRDVNCSFSILLLFHKRFRIFAVSQNAL
jgi:hypothetical protein